MILYVYLTGFSFTANAPRLVNSGSIESSFSHLMFGQLQQSVGLRNTRYLSFRDLSRLVQYSIESMTLPSK